MLNAAKLENDIAGIFMSKLCDRSNLWIKYRITETLMCKCFITHDSNPSPENIFSGRNLKKLYDASTTRMWGTV